MRHLLLVCAACGLASAQPYIAYRGVYNVASFMPAGLPGGAIARGSTFAIFGRNIGPSSTPQLSFPLATTLGGVTITVTQGSTTVNAIPVGLTSGQINAIMPSNAPLGLATLRLSYNNGRSNPLPVQIVNSSFGIFTANSAGNGPGILQNTTTVAQPINSLQGPATPGSAVILWGTGLGPVTFPDNVAPSPGNLSIQTEVFVGGVKAAIQYNGRSPCCAGIDQIVFQVPANAPLGCWVPVYVRTGGTVVSNFVTMAISPDGSPCKEPNNALASALINGGKIGAYAAARVSTHEDIAVPATRDVQTDLLAAYQAQEKQQPFSFNPMFSLPPAGSCTVYSILGDLATDDKAIIAGMTPPSGAALDAGSVAVGGAKGSQTAQGGGTYPGMSGVQLAGSILGLPVTNTTFLDPAGFSLTLGGGKDIAGATASFTVPAPFTWTNRDQISPVTRASGLTVNWSGGDPSASTFIVASGVDLLTIPPLWRYASRRRETPALRSRPTRSPTFRHPDPARCNPRAWCTWGNGTSRIRRRSPPPAWTSARSCRPWWAARR